MTTVAVDDIDTVVADSAKGNKLRQQAQVSAANERIAAGL